MNLIMKCKIIFIVFVFFNKVSTGFDPYTDPHCDGKQVIVHLFEWKWSDVANECERFLSKKGFCGVQVSPANEHVMVKNPPRPWWERYQPVSYKLHSRSGTEAEFTDMVQRCRNVGVRIYVDVVLNHMAGLGRNGTGTDGSYFNSDTYNFTGVPYEKEHFNKYCPLNSWDDEHIMKDCHLLGLTDLNHQNVYVQDKIAEFLNNLIDHGVAGFRVDAAKHMWTKDIVAIQQKVKDLPEGGRPFFVHEVIDQHNSPITTQQYTSLGYVTEFRYSQKVKEGIDDFGRLFGAVDYGWGMEEAGHAFVFVDNHDTERGNEAITFTDPLKYKMAVAFVLANDYGFARVMSSYYFGKNNDLGPPHNVDYSIKDVTISSNGSCQNGWVCEHRWAPIANMVAFRNAVTGTQKENFYNQNNQIAFSRGNKGFFAMAHDGHMDVTLQTGLPPGEYCDLITDCARKITVDGSGMAHIVINNGEEPMVAFIVKSSDGMLTTPGQTHGASTSTSTSSSTSSSTPSLTSSSTASTSSSVSNIVSTATTSPLASTPTSAVIGTNMTSAMTTSPSTSTGWHRTVILFERPTSPGENLFIRGGLDRQHHPDCSNVVSDTNPCVIPIKDRLVGTHQHYDGYNAWRVNDNFLDWDGAEANQGRYNGMMAQGTPAVWTTNDGGHPGHSEFNTYGPHYWLVDMDMDCAKTDNGWFEVKAVLNGQWEQNIHSQICQGADTNSQPPYETINHWALCGKLNIFHVNQDSCEVKDVQ